MVYAFAEHWRRAGHTVITHRGSAEPPPGDVAILHLDVTVVPAEYHPLLSRYRRVLNGKVLDISKRAYSQHLLSRGDGSWRGPVIVKTNTNFLGRPEAFINEAARRAGRTPPLPPTYLARGYPVFDSLAQVPEAIWANPDAVVERFLPERDEQGRYCVRVWTFFGERERCVKWHAREKIVKASNTVERTPLEPPRELRAWRERLGFDFGKFDYVVHEGKELLLDANRTPSFPTEQSPNALAAAADLAAGIDGFLAS